jgi:hypothetical protein
MSDPLGASGTAVGIISLGLTVCDALFQYYDAWKSYGTDIAHTAASIQHLAQIFTNINQITSNGHLQQAQRQILEDSLSRCEASLQKLEKKVKKIMPLPLPKDIVDHLRNAKRRLLYPFLESTLAKIRENISEAEAALDTVMNKLQM